MWKSLKIDRDIHVCMHCGWYPISGAYCDDCSTIKKRKEMDKIQLKDFGKKYCKCK